MGAVVHQPSTLNAKTPLRKWLRFLHRFSLVALFVFSIFFFLYHLLFLRRVIPGVYLGGIDLSGKSYSHSVEEIRRYFSAYEQEPLVMNVGPVSQTVLFSQLGIQFLATESAAVAFRLGRSRSLLSDVKMEFQALLFRHAVTPVLVVDEGKMTSTLTDMEAALARRDASFLFDEGRLLVTPEKEGLVFSLGDLREKVIAAAKNLDSSVSLVADDFPVEVTAKHLEALRAEFYGFYLSRPILRFGSQAWRMTDEEFVGLFDLRLSNPGDFVFSPTNVAALIGRVSRSVNSPAKAVGFEAEGEKVISFTPGEDGLVVAETELAAALEKAVLSRSGAPLTVPVERIKPEVVVNDYGIKELLGEGFSNFAGSIPGRRHNIKLAAGKLNGILIPSGKIFSFNEAVGEVSAQTGYDYAYIIAEGRTVLGTGGGLCQVSTTVFRAALNAGLPILKRTAHAYRVHYYEEGGSPVGLDATVFSPSVDLQFKNDTGNFILVQSIYDGSAETLAFRFYGTRDGREVKLTGPVITAATPAPPSRYENDPTLPKGVVRQVDFAAGGLSVFFERRVERNGETLIEESFYSRYAPWQAVYLVGTAE